MHTCKEIDQEAKDKILSIISALAPHVKVYLFGSRAWGSNVAWSDIDLTLDAGKEMVMTDVGEIRDVIGELNIPYKVDVVDLHEVTSEMRALILQEGIVWKS